MSPRVYERRFDWDEARRLHSQGVSHRKIAEAMGVSPAAVYRVVSDERLAYDRERVAAWQRSGTCPDCGAQTTRRSVTESSRCVPCHARHMTTTVREGELRCSSCQEWKPDSAFPRNRSETHRRGRHGQCTPCQTRSKRDYRRRHPEYPG